MGGDELPSQRVRDVCSSVIAERVIGGLRLPQRHAIIGLDLTQDPNRPSGPVPGTIKEGDRSWPYDRRRNNQSPLLHLQDQLQSRAVLLTGYSNYLYDGDGVIRPSLGG